MIYPGVKFNTMNEQKLERMYHFPLFSVRMTSNTLTYIYKNKDNIIYRLTIPTFFDITVDELNEGGKIEINFIDRWGSSMRFIHHRPSSLEGLFIFIGKGYDIECIKQN